MRVLEAPPASAFDETPVPATLVRDRKRKRFALTIRERRALLAVMDFVIGALACYVTYVVIRKPGAHPLHFYDPLILGTIWVTALLIADGYAFQIPSNRSESGFVVAKALPIAALLTVLVFFIHPYVLTRPVLVGSLLFGAACLAFVRVTAARLLLHQSLAISALLVSDGVPSREVLASLDAARFEYRVVGSVVDVTSEDGDSGSLVPRLGDLVAETGAEEVILTGGELRLHPGLAEACLAYNVRLVSAGDIVERYMGRVPIDTVDVHWYLSLPSSDVWKRPYALARRAFDLILATVLGIPALVLLPFLALLIRLDSPGPVFLRQVRVGRNGRQFTLYKLRSMVESAEAPGAQFATANDPRATRIGRFLRATRLDEFPQFLNIIRGDMSFIGPRPERPEFESMLEASIPHFRSRLLIKPGLTGWAQIRGGYAGSIEEATRKLEYDLYYLKNRSARLDLQILIATIAIMFARRGR